jgi:hypothetical protein
MERGDSNPRDPFSIRWAGFVPSLAHYSTRKRACVLGQSTSRKFAFKTLFCSPTRSAHASWVPFAAEIAKPEVFAPISATQV